MCVFDNRLSNVLKVSIVLYWLLHNSIASVQVFHWCAVILCLCI
jgi:hypothetical protein